MGGKQHRSMFHTVLHQPAAGSPRYIGQLAEFRIPMGRVDLQRMMQHIAREHRSASCIREPHDDVTTSVAGSRDHDKAVIYRMIPVNQYCLSRFDDWQDTVEVSASALKVRLCRGISAWIAYLVFRARKQVFRIRERRYPASVLQHRIPTDVIGVKMCAKHEIDLFRLHTSRTKPMEEGRIELMESRKTGTLLLVAGTAIEQDRVFSGANQP